jgi:hypothetical protein
MTMPLPDEPITFATDVPDVVDRPTLRASGPAEIVQIIPYQLGFHPEESVVLLGLRGRRMAVSVRFDLDAPAAAAEPWCAAAHKAGADRVVVAIYSEDEHGAGLPHRGYLDELAELFAKYGLEEVDALLVGAGRWWSYRCSSDRCCPRAGTPVDRDGAIAAGAVAEGLVALPSRRELEKELAPDPVAVRQVDDALYRWGVAELDEGPLADTVVRARDWAAVRAFVRDAETPGYRPSPDEAAKVLAALTDLYVRDATVGFLALPPKQPVADAWRLLTRMAPEHARAPVATIYALWCFARGSGARTNVAVDVALAADPDYSMAILLAEMQTAGMNPFELMHDLGHECRLIGRRIQRKRDPRSPEQRRRDKKRADPR